MQVRQVKIGDFRQITSSVAFIILSIHLCLQHVCRGAARGAGSSATAGTCKCQDGIAAITHHSTVLTGIDVK